MKELRTLKIDQRPPQSHDLSASPGPLHTASMAPMDGEEEAPPMTPKDGPSWVLG